jgi:hypothetical protein
MADSERSKRLPTWVRAIGFGGLTVATSVLLVGLFYQMHYSQQAEERASEYARNAASEIYQPCRVSPLPKLDECLAKAKREYTLKRNDNQRDFADLVAQQRSALWGAVMGIAALIGIMLSAIGVWLVYTTLRETKRSADLANANVQAFFHAERGVAVIEKPFSEAPFAEIFLSTFVLKVRNAGRSLIRVTRVTGGWRDDFAKWEWDEQRQFESISDQPCRPDMPISVVVSGIRKSHPPRSVILGTIWYDTLGMTDCKSHFAFSVSVVGEDEVLFRRFHTSEQIPRDT